MSFLRQFITKFKDLVKPTERSRFHPESTEDSQEKELSDDEKLDETIAESMIASDPPGHISKSTEDKSLHEI